MLRPTGWCPNLSAVGHGRPAVACSELASALNSLTRLAEYTILGVLPDLAGMDHCLAVLGYQHGQPRPEVKGITVKRRRIMKARNLWCLALVACVLGLLGTATDVQAVYWVYSSYRVAAIPNYVGSGGWPGALNGGFPRVANWDVVWTGPAATNMEIFRFDGNATTQLTTTGNPLGSFGSFIDGPDVVNMSDDGTNYQLWHHNLTTASSTQLTSYGDLLLRRINDSHYPNVALEVMDQWLGGPWIPSFVKVELWDGSKIVQLSSRTYNVGPKVGVYNVVWQAYGAATAGDIFMYNITSGTTTQLTSRAPWSHGWPEYSEPFITWSATDGSASDVTLYKPSTIPFVQQIAYSTTSQYQFPLGITATPTRADVFWAWNDDTQGYGVYYYRYDSINPPHTFSTKLFTPMLPHFVCDDIAVCSSHVAFVINDPGGGQYTVYLWDIVNGGPIQTIGSGMSPAPVYLDITKQSFPPYGDVPVVVWEENLGGPTKAFIATRPVCTTQILGDLDKDCEVTNNDFTLLSAAWGSSGPGLPEDLDGSGTVDAGDLAILVSNWLSCNLQPLIFRGAVTFP